MKFRTIKKWDNPENSAALLYFAQLLEEMLFDFSLDTYKAPILHAGLLCVEALQTLDEVDAGNIAAPNINHVAEELYSNLERDPVSIELLELPVTSFAATLNNKKSTPKEVRSVVELLHIQLSTSKYLKKNQELLSSSIKNNCPPAELRRLTRTLVTTLTAIGFSAKYIREKSQDFFFFGSNRISDNSAIDEFIAIFSESNNNYKVVFRAEKLFEPFAEAFKPVGLDISQSCKRLAKAS